MRNEVPGVTQQKTNEFHSFTKQKEEITRKEKRLTKLFLISILVIILLQAFLLIWFYSH